MVGTVPGITLAFKVPVTAAAGREVNPVAEPVNVVAVTVPVVEMIMLDGKLTDVRTARLDTVALEVQTLLWVMLGTVLGITLAFKVPVTAAPDTEVNPEPEPVNDAAVTVPVVDMVMLGGKEIDVGTDRFETVALDVQRLL